MTDADFKFRVGNSSDLASWTSAPDPASVVYRPGEGANGSDRVEITWDDGAIRGEWLEVRVLAASTGLAADDVFYFGNAPGESGNDPTNTYVDGSDMAGPPRSFPRIQQPGDGRQ